MQQSRFPDRSTLREHLRAERKKLAPAERAERSERAQRFVLELPEWRKAVVVALYVAVRGETETDLLLREAWARGKNVLLPLCDAETAGLMDFVPCEGPERLLPGRYGIPEPECLPNAETPRPEIIVMPGVAFDRQGFRLGMGGGFYDRLLARPEYGGAIRLGLAYDFQLLERLPREGWDVPVHAVCTEKGALWTRDPLR